MLSPACTLVDDEPFGEGRKGSERKNRDLFDLLGERSEGEAKGAGDGNQQTLGTLLGGTTSY